MGQNCAASVSIGCLFCCKGCNAEKLRNAFTFIPPDASYAVQPLGEDTAEQAQASNRWKMVYQVDSLKTFAFYQQAADHAEIKFLKTSRGETVPLVWISRSQSSSASAPPPDAGPQPLVILHCHGNATDIGMMMGPYFELSKQLGVEVVGVEYSGYGASTGLPCAGNTYSDVEAAYDYVVSRGVAADRIVAYGQSVGSGPVCYLSSKRKLGGIILHSPLMSGIKVIDPDPDRCCRPSCVYHCLDFYPNDKRIKTASCPAFIIHGQRDDIVPYYHGRSLSESTPKDLRWPGYFPKNAGHNNIVEQNVQVYFGEVHNFLNGVAQRVVGGAVVDAAWTLPKGMPGPGAATQQEVNAKVQAAMQAAPSQIEMAKLGGNSGDFAAAGAGSGSASQYQNPPKPHAPEPIVGPEDGRYAQWRGQGQPGDAGLRAAREVRELQVATGGGALNPGGAEPI